MCGMCVWGCVCVGVCGYVCVWGVCVCLSGVCVCVVCRLSCSNAGGILASIRGIKPESPALQDRFFTTRLRRRPLSFI